MAKDRISAKDVMKPHSEAKVRFYQRYLETRLLILSSVAFVKEIHIYDLFCGRGIYKNGKTGSPIRAYETIREVRRQRPSNNRIVLHLNDKNAKHIETVHTYLESHFGNEEKICEVVYTQKDANEMLGGLAARSWCGRLHDGVVNVFFIDPYGYKEIKRELLEHLMDSGNSEILLFLPISFMHRFTRHAFSNKVTPGALPLKRLIASFFHEQHPMRTRKEMGVQEYIDHFTKAFTCGGRFYTTSYPIERNEKNLFALFFFSTSIFGYEKVLEQKWRMMDCWGFGFHLPEMERGFFDEIFKQERLQEMTEGFRVKMLNFLSTKTRTNSEVYRFAVENGFLPKHAKDVLRNLQENGQLLIVDMETGEVVEKRNQFHVDYKGYRNPSYLFLMISKCEELFT